MASPSSLNRVDSVLTPAHHPPKKHTTTLADLCDDVLLIICSHLSHTLSNPLKTLSLVNHRLSLILRPHLFKTLHISSPLSHLCKTLPPLPLTHAHTLKLDMFGSLWWWCSGLYVSARDAIDIFTFIHGLPNLKTLEISMLGRSLDLFESAFSTAAEDNDPSLFMLPNVEHLHLTPSASFLVRHCPNLRTLVIRDASSCTIEPYIPLPDLLLPSRPVFPPCTQTLSLPTTTLQSLSPTLTWSTPELNFLVSTFPHLRTLSMTTPLHTYRAPIHSILTTLSHLPHLHTLHLNRIHKLDVGYRSVWKRRVQECRTKEERIKLWEGDERARVGAENEVVRGAMRVCKALRVVWVGAERVARRLDKGEEGEGVRWMWERRREDAEGEGEGVSAVWARFRVEKEGVVRAWEVGM
ncbi:hypothetical protein NX059_009847 [Plenodomus lindquistii]|nr:hypothetical protein NX059_009847 [Plenodomus lindquistii]